ncbi:MAG: TonB-dependent receptor, partial [Gammaproteobacteria bacterium]
PFIPVGSFDFLSDQTVDATSIAGFGHVVWHVNDRLNLTGGIRYTHEEKIQTESRLDSDTLQPSANPAFADFAAQGGSLTSTFTGSRLDYRFSADYRWADQLMTYFTFSTGFKSGGSNPRPFFGSQFLPFDEETVKSFEAGFKSDLFDQRLRLNADYFFALYSDIQLVPLTCDDISPFPSAPCAAPRNLADGQISGVELEATFLPTDHLSIDTSMSYIKLNFTKVDPAAVGPVDPTLDRPENTPTWKASAGAQYEIPMGDWGTLTPRVDVAYEGEKSGLAGTAGLVIDSYTLINARLTWRSADDTWEAAFSATNIGDTEYLYNTFDLTGAGAAWQSTHPAKPREWNFTVRHSF